MTAFNDIYDSVTLAPSFDRYAVLYARDIIYFQFIHSSFDYRLLPIIIRSINGFG
jgi:hypothetical protein